MAEKESELEIAVRSLFRIQSFDTNTLPQIERLGADLNFQDVARPAERIVNFFRQIPSERLGSLPEPKLADTQGQADLAFNLFGDILKFDPKQPDAYNVRTKLINQVERQYESLFGALSGVVSFLSSLQKDFAALERDARAAVQAAKDRANEAVEELTKQQARAQEILDEVRRVAAEQGVSQQATYFQQEGERHEKAAKEWQKYTVCIAIGLGSFAALTATMHKWGWLRPDGAYETAQFVVSKVLLFGVVVYMLVLSARTLLAHRHNAVINRHRYNAFSNMAMLQCLRGVRDDGATVHGFRASFSTWAREQTDYSAEIIEASLAHTQSDKVVAAYARTTFIDRRRELMADWAAFCMGG